jgi:hypothetical protein
VGSVLKFRIIRSSEACKIVISTLPRNVLILSTSQAFTETNG